MPKIILRHVRSFWIPQPISIKPLTLIVGENSTGKTTFLSMMAQIYRFEFPQFQPSFNEQPFDLGPFSTIATYKGGRGGRSNDFTLGLLEENGAEQRKITATYVNHRGQPQLSEVEASAATGNLSVRFQPDARAAQLVITLKDSERIDVNVDLERFGPQRLATSSILPVLRISVLEWLQKRPQGEAFGAGIQSLLSHLDVVRGLAKRVFAFAPVRTRPRRTYDEVSGDFDPEGNHVFALLARLWLDRDTPESARIFAELKRFGDASNLFRKVNVKLLGPDPSDPFQVRVATTGPVANLIDVGYGVSQALPLIVQSLRVGANGVLLLQEPEIHLHPRAQAALGSFFAHLVAREGPTTVIETHSDYLIDRVRVEIARGTIKESDVQILFFEKKRMNTIVHELALDKAGNIQDAPPTYRRFFLEEEINLLRRTAS